MKKADIVNKIIAEYTADLNAQRIEIAARLAAARSDAGFAALESELNGLYIDRGRVMSDNDGRWKTEDGRCIVEIAQIDAKIAELEKKREQFLRGRGIETELKYRCGKCRDTGWDGGELCFCVKQRLYDEMAADSGLAFVLRDFKEADLNAFPAAVREERKKLYALMKKYCEKFPNTKYRNLFFSGSTGTGKTFLASCIASEILKRGETVQFLTSFAFNAQALKIYTAPLEERDGLLNTLLDPALLILDDLGAEPVLNNVTVEYLYLILNERLIRGGHTVITTNLDPANFLSRYGSRVFSRAVDKANTYAAQFGWQDFRLQMTNDK